MANNEFKQNYYPDIAILLAADCTTELINRKPNIMEMSSSFQKLFCENE